MKRISRSHSLLLVALLLAGCATATPSSTPTIPPTSTRLPTRTSYFLFTQDPEKGTPIIGTDVITGWLNGIPCEAPCWEGVTPGETSRIEAANIWSTNPFFSSVEIESTVPRSPVDFVLNIIAVSSCSGNMYRIGGEGYGPLGETGFLDPNAPISLIRLGGFDQVTLADLIQAFGPPSYVAADLGFYGGSDNGWILSIIWLDKGFSIIGYDGLPTPTINRDLSFPEGNYFSPGEEGFRQTDMARDHSGNFIALHPWHGYDSFDGYYTEPMPTQEYHP